MADLKSLSREAIGRAMEKAERYRLLNEPAEAESICLDVLRLEPANQPALVALLLSLTDQFDLDAPEVVSQAKAILPRLQDEYAQAYYAGIIAERRAKARLRQGGPASGHVAHDFLREAMALFEKAESLRPAGNDDALLRYNACVRILERHPHVTQAPHDRSEPPLE
jgi:hypothetical protein